MSEPYAAVARGWLSYELKKALATKHYLVTEWRAEGNAALSVMPSHLAKDLWFAGERYAIADIAFYSYTHGAGEGRSDLSRDGAVSKWLERVAGEPGYIP